MKRFLFSTLLMFVFAGFMTSCQKDAQPVVKQTLDAKLANDADFAKLLTSTSDLLNYFDFSALNDDQKAVVLDFIKKGNKATQLEKEQVVAILGVSPERFTQDLDGFLGSIAQLENKYQLSKLSQTELTAAIGGALNLNPELKMSLESANGKAGSDGAKICRGVVSLASLLGGGALCTAIGVTTIPVVGGVLCTVITTLASGILNALCDLIP